MLPLKIKLMLFIKSNIKIVINCILAKQVEILKQDLKNTRKTSDQENLQAKFISIRLTLVIILILIILLCYTRIKLIGKGGD